MKAFTVTEPYRTAIREIDPPRPAPDEVLLRVRYVGLCGSDLKTFRGLNPLVSYPRIPGHEISASVAAAGDEVPADWPVGARVTLSPYTSCGRCTACRRGRPNACRENQTLGVQRDGALTEHLAVPWRKLFAAPDLPWKEAALVEPLTVGGHAVGRGEVGPADTVAVIGCGLIGLGAVAAAARREARVIAVDIDDAKLDVARKAGARHAVNTAAADLHRALQDLTDGNGPDVVLEAAGTAPTFRAAAEEAAFAGRIVYIGYVREPVAYETRLFVQKELDLRGSRNALPDDFADAIRLLAAGRFPVADVITRVFPLDRAGEALAGWHAAPSTITRILIEI